MKCTCLATTEISEEEYLASWLMASQKKCPIFDYDSTSSEESDNSSDNSSDNESPTLPVLVIVENVTSTSKQLQQVPTAGNATYI